MSEFPLVSVIIPAYNSARFIRVTIESALNQDYPNFEIVVVDDGSTDETPEILKEYASERCRVFLESHIGCVPNYNRCLRYAQGRYIAILDHDDVMLPGRLRRQAEYLESHPELCMVGSAYEIVGEKGEFLESRPMPSGPSEVRRFEGVFNAVQHPTAMYRRHLVDEIGEYREEYFPSHDSEFILRAIARFDADNLPEYLTRWRRVRSSPTTGMSEIQSRLHYEMRRDYNEKAFAAAKDRGVKGQFALNLGKISYYRGRVAETFIWLTAALRYRPANPEIYRYLFALPLMPLIRMLRKRGIVLPIFRKRKSNSADWRYYSP